MTSITQAHEAFAQLISDGTSNVTLLFSHPAKRQDISHDSLPIVSSTPFAQPIHDQMNHHWDFLTIADYL